MKWVVVAILVFVVGYTVVMLLYRKPDKPYRPYQDSADRATTLKLLKSGYQRITIQAQSLGIGETLDVVHGGEKAALKAHSGGLEAELAASLATKPLLPDSYLSASAAASVSSAKEYLIRAEAKLPDNNRIISSAFLFRKGTDAYLVPVFEAPSGKLQARFRETTLLLTLPAGSLPAGTHNLTLVGSKRSLTWQILVRQ